jgi:hypothetical protein
MENVSKTPCKRGRPPAFEAELVELYRRTFPQAKGRSLMNRVYQGNALSVLKNDPAFHWLTSNKAEIDDGTGSMRSAILYELGRIEDADELRNVATMLCSVKPKTTAAVAMIRRCRHGERPASANALAHALSRCVNDYLAKHPSATWELVHQAMDILKMAVQDTESDSDGQQTVDLHA